MKQEGRNTEEDVHCLSSCEGEVRKVTRNCDRKTRHMQTNRQRQTGSLIDDDLGCIILQSCHSKGRKQGRMNVTIIFIHDRI